MPSFVLPSRPSTDQLKRQARELRQSYLDADTAARDRVEPYRSLLPSDAGGLTLTDAKLVLAREYGFESWPKLKHHVAELRGGYDELGRFMDLVRSGEADHAKFIADHGFATSIVRAGLQVDLHVAARFDLLERLISLLEEDPARVHSRDEAGLTPLHWTGSTRVWQVLVHNYGAELEARDTPCGATPAQWAVVDHRPDVARALIADGAQSDPVLLCGLNMVDELSAALRETPGFRGSFELDRIPGGGVYARALGERTTLLHVAAHFGIDGVIRMLLDEGADPEMTDASSATPLHRAAARGDMAIVSLLLERGASPSQADSAGATALHQAASSGHAAIAKLLLDQGASPGATKDDGSRPLDAAVDAATAAHHGPARRDGAVEIAEALVRAGVSVGAVTIPTGRDDLDAVIAGAAD